jgi:hypothetical protein
MTLNHSIVLEAINAPTSIVGFMLIGFMFWYVVDTHSDKEGRSIWRCWLCGDLDQRLQFGVAMFFLFLGTGIVRGWAWVFRHIVNSGSQFPIDGGSKWQIIGGFVTLAAMLCLVRIVTIARFGKWPWRIATIVAAASAIGTFYLPPF